MDPISLAAASVGAGMSAGLAVISATVAVVGLLRSPLPLLLGGTVGGLLLAGVTTWGLLAPVGSAYRRGGLAMVSAFATVVLMLVTMPLNHYLGRPGLVGLAVAAAASALLLTRRARRLGAAT